MQRLVSVRLLTLVMSRMCVYAIVIQTDSLFRYIWLWLNNEYTEDKFSKPFQRIKGFYLKKYY